MDHSELDSVDLQLEIVNNRKKYAPAIKLLVQKLFKVRIKSLENKHKTELKRDEIVNMPIQNVSVANLKYNTLSEEEIALKSALKQQILVMKILQDQINCPVAQKMYKI